MMLIFEYLMFDVERGPICSFGDISVLTFGQKEWQIGIFVMKQAAFAFIQIANIIMFSEQCSILMP